MKLRVRYKRQREVIDLPGEVITWNDFRTAVCRQFGITTRSFDVSLNGQDIIDNTSESLVQLGVVSGDLIYILPKDEEQVNEVPVLDTSGIASNSRNANETEGCSQGRREVDLSSGIASNSRDANEIEGSPEGVREVDLPGSTGSSSAGTDQLISSTLEHGKACSTDQVYQKAGPSNIPRNQSPHVLLCREGIPEVLEHLFKTQDVGTIHKAVWIVIHVLMMETGYNSCVSEDNDSDKEVDDWRKVIPSADWERGSLCRIKYTHVSCPGLMCSLTCTSLGPYFMIHGLVDSDHNSEVYQCRLQPTDFVRGNVDLKTCGASAAYYNLHRLSRLVKDQVAYPLLSFMRATLGLPQLSGLMVLPTEVKLMIFRNLAMRSVLNLSSTCHELHTLSNDSSLWEHFVVRDFGHRIKEQHRSWKMEYIHLYKQKKVQKRMQSEITLPPIEFFPAGRGLGSHSFGGDTFPPGIIGGHSDLYPNLPFVPGGINPPPGFQPGPGLPRPRFDPFGPLPDNNHTPGHLRGRRPGRPGNFHPSFF